MAKHVIRLHEGNFFLFFLSLHNDLCAHAGDPGADDTAQDEFVLVPDLDPDPGLAPLHPLAPETGLSEAVLTVRELGHNPECGGGQSGGGVGRGKLDDVFLCAKNFF